MPRKSDRRTRKTGRVYLLCFRNAHAPDVPARFKHAAHYIGFVAGDEDELNARLAEHATGRGARLLEVIKGVGMTFKLTRTWTGATRSFERALKHNGGGRYCPECNALRRTLLGDPWAAGSTLDAMHAEMQRRAAH